MEASEDLESLEILHSLGRVVDSGGPWKDWGFLETEVA